MTKKRTKGTDLEKKMVGDNMDQIKTSNEITIKITSDLDTFIDVLKRKGLHEVEKFYLEDDYYIPNKLDISHMTPREILTKAILVRTCIGNSGESIFLAFKEKNIAEDGTIISQKSTNCKVYRKEDAAEFVKAIGYKHLMNIKENDIVYENDEINIAIKDIVDGDILAELETNNDSKFGSIKGLEKKIEELDLPIVKGQYFFKKAEIELEKLKNK